MVADIEPARTLEENTTDDFDPKNFPLIKVSGGKLYLEVKYRLLWMMHDNERYRIDTELLDYNADLKQAIIKASITLGDGRHASGIGSETKANFEAGHIEKAETTAIGRALALLGYGTQHTGAELETGPNKLADSPVAASDIPAMKPKRPLGLVRKK